MNQPLTFDCPQGCGAKIAVDRPSITGVLNLERTAEYERQLGKSVLCAVMGHVLFECQAFDDAPYQHPAPESEMRRQ